MDVSPVSLPRRHLLQATGAAAALVLAGCRTPAPGAGASSARLRLLGEATLPYTLRHGGTPVGGLSGLDFDPASGRWIALSDDRSQRAPARAYTLDLQFGPGWLTVRPLDVITLLQPDGRPWPAQRKDGEVVDPEAVRLRAGGASFFWTSEGDAAGHRPPALREATLQGRHLRDIPLPAPLHFGQGRGARSNATLEGLALTPDGRHAWVAMEGPLLQDGPPPSPDDGGGPVRLTLLDLASARVLRQLAYPLDPLPARPLVAGGWADNGVSEVLLLDAHRLLVLERAYVLGAGTSMRLYEIDTRAGTDVQQMARLDGGGWQAPPKRLLADFATLGLARLDNTEAMAWGPPLPGGGRTLVVASDNNFNPMQVTQFAAFEFLEST